MQFARFWTSHTAIRSGRAGQKEATAWGWSDVSEADALNRARQRAEAFADRLASGGGIAEGYLQYADRPLREQVLQEIVPGHSVVTRNLAGCEILNVADVAFVDIDIHASATIPGSGFLAGLFGGGKPRTSPRDRAIEEALKRLRDWVSSNPRQGFRIYETAGGLRYLLCTQRLQPDAPSTEAMFRALKADPAYGQLCRVQKSFRARLTPKPWRCGVEKPSCRFPYAGTEDPMKEWEKIYASSSAGFATCRFITHAGAPEADPAISDVIEFHDRRTRANETLTLA